MSATQISPISAAQHYATSAQFWEQQAKLLRHELDQVNAKLAALEKEPVPPPPETEPDTQA